MTSETVSRSVSVADVMHARRVLSQYLHPSPLVEAPALTEQLGCRVYLKLDNMMPTGAFKVRGGVFLLSQLSSAERGRGIVAATRGNHGQSLAYACRLFQSRCRLFVPYGNSRFKNTAMRRLGAVVTEVGEDFDEACAAAAAHARRTGALLVHPGEEPRLFAGIGTWALEALEQSPVGFDAAFVPVGVGSCLAGGIPVFEAISPHTELVGVSAAAAPAFARSIEAREIQEWAVEPGLADGLAVRRPPELAFQTVLESTSRVCLVEEYAIRSAMHDLLICEGIVAEGAAASTLAAARSYALEHQGSNILLMLTGRNIDNGTLKDVLKHNNRKSVRAFVAT